VEGRPLTNLLHACLQCALLLQTPTDVLLYLVNLGSGELLLWVDRRFHCSLLLLLLLLCLLLIGELLNLSLSLLLEVVFVGTEVRYELVSLYEHVLARLKLRHDRCADPASEPRVDLEVLRDTLSYGLPGALKVGLVLQELLVLLEVIELDVDSLYGVVKARGEAVHHGFFE